MKRITQLTIAVVALISCNLVQAQVPYLNSDQNYYDEIAQLKAKHPKLENKDRQSFTVYLDYATAAGDNAGALSNINSNYLATDTALTYAAVVFDQIAGYTDPTAPSTSIVYYNDLGLWNAYPSNLSITVDSLFWIGSQENNSGNMDYFTTQIVTTNGTGVPTSTILWSTTDSTNVSFSSSGNWTGTGALFQLGYAPAFVTSPGQKIGVAIDYNDPSKLDSCGLVGTGVDLVPTGGDGAADSASVYKNSFCKYLYISPNLLKNANLVYTAGGAYLLQDWNIWLRVTFDYNIGINDVNNNLSVANIYPNPANASANVHFFLEKTSDLEVTVADVTGKMVQSVYSGSMAQGHQDMKINTSNLPSGIYLVNMKADNGNVVSSKLVVAH